MINESGIRVAPLARARNRRLADIYLRSGLSLGAYGFWLASGWPSHVDDEMREHGRCCWRWAFVCGLLIPCLLGCLGGFILAVVVLITAVLPKGDVGVLLIIYEIAIGNLYLLVLAGYSLRAYRRVLAGESFVYPLAGFRIFGSVF